LFDPPQAPFAIKEDSPLYNIFDERWDSDCSESDDPDCNKLIKKIVAEHDKKQIGQIGSLADEDPNPFIQAATADTSYLPDANCQGEPCAISHAFEPRYTCSHELLQRLTNFILPPSPPYSGHENTKECTGFLCVNKTGLGGELGG
jgi:hypothetical protein